MPCQGQLVQVDTQTGAEIPLLIEIDPQHAISRPGKTDGKVEGDRCFAAAALSICGGAMSAKT